MGSNYPSDGFKRQARKANVQERRWKCGRYCCNEKTAFVCKTRVSTAKRRSHSRSERLCDEHARAWAARHGVEVPS